MIDSKFYPQLGRVVFAISLNLIALATFADLPKAGDQTIIQMLSGEGSFIENKGQLSAFYGWNPSSDSVQFYLPTAHGMALFSRTSVDFGLHGADDTDINLHLTFHGQNANTQISATEIQQGKYNYYTRANEQLIALENISRFNAITYEEAYDLVDITYYISQGKLKYDIIAQPGAQIDDIALQYAGADQAYINNEGHLIFETKSGTIQDMKPYTYQIIDGQEVEISSQYVKKAHGRFGFELGRLADPTQPVVIDPYTLEWGTFVGVMGADAGGYPFEFVIGWDGAIYGTGRHHPNWPTINAFDNVIYGGEGVVFKLNNDATAFEYASFVGGQGAGFMEAGMGCSVNPDGELFVVGITDNATGFPVTTPNLGSVVTGPSEAFAGKINADGTLAYMTLLGGAGDDRAFGVDYDGAGNIVVGGWTSSTGLGTAGTIKPNHSGLNGGYADLDGFVASINPNTNTLNFFTYYGGNGGDQVRKLDIDDAGNIYICGSTNSTTGIAGPVSFQPTLQGDYDGYVAKLNPTASTVIHGSYIGGVAEDDAEALHIKCNDEIVVGGTTRSDENSFPVVNAWQPTYAGAKDGFMVRVSSTGAGLLNSTFIGTTMDDGIKKNHPFDPTNMQKNTDVAVNHRGEIAFALTTGTGGMPTPDGFQTAPAGGNVGLAEAYVHVFDSTGLNTVYGTYIGGDGNDYPTAGIAYDPVNDQRFLVGGASHSNLGSMFGSPGTVGPVAETLNDEYYCYVFSQCTLEVELSAASIPACEGDPITFTGDTICEATIPDSIIWTVNGVIVDATDSSEWTTSDLSDGDEVCLIHLWLGTCRQILQGDTACVTVTIEELSDFDLGDTTICSPNSILLSPDLVYDNYEWSDGSTDQSLTVDQSGTYHLTVSSASGCTQRDTVMVDVVQLEVLTLNDTAICEGLSLNVSAPNDVTVLWNDASTDIARSFDSEGIYHLTVTDINGCTDRDTFALTLNDAPNAVNITETCALDNLTYTVSFDIENGDAGSYQIDGNPVGGTAFTSPSINTGDAYSFELSDDNGCEIETIEGQRLCNCITDAGTMSSTTLDVCLGDDFTFTHNADHVADGDDTLMFIVHTLQGPNIGTVIHAEKGIVTTTVNTTDWAPGTYYVSALAGNTLLGDSVDLTDLCLDVSLGQPVVVHEIPTIEIDGAGTVCEGGEITFDITLNGEGLFHYDVLLDGANWGSFASLNDTTFTTQDSGAYTLTNASDRYCDAVASGQADATIIPMPDSLLTVSDPTVCIETFANIDVSVTENGKSYQFINAEDMTNIGGPISGNGGTISLNLFPSTNLTYIIEVTDDIHGCSAILDDTAFVTVNPPIEGAMPDNIVLCEAVTNTTLELTNSVVGVDYTLRLDSDDSVIDGPVNGNDGTIAFDISGMTDQVFNVLATDGLSCEFELPDLGSVTISPDIEIALSTTDITCSNACDGSAEFEVSGGLGDLSIAYLLDGTTIRGQALDTSFTDLCAVDLTVTATDTAGCFATDNATWTNPTVVSFTWDTVRNVSCTDSINGSITVSGNGGTAPYSYNWSNGASTDRISDLDAGQYLVTVSDANDCQSVGGNNIEEPLPIDVIVQFTEPVVCEGELVNIIVLSTGGNENHTFTPFVNAQDVFSGFVESDTTFVFTVTDENGCTAADSISIAIPTYPIVSPGDTDTVCVGANRMMEANATGGLAPYTYLWDGGSTTSALTITTTDLGMTTTMVNVSDACSQSDVATFYTFARAQPDASFTTDVTPGCDDGLLQVTNGTNEPGAVCDWQIFSGTTNVFQNTSCDDFSITLAEGEYDLLLDIAIYGCTDQVKGDAIITLPDAVEADFTFLPENPVPFDQSLVQFENQSINGNIAQWVFDTLGVSSEWSPQFEFPYENTDTFLVNLTVFNDIGCEDQITKRVIIGGDVVLYLPSAFTPGNDARNESWGPEVLGSIEFYEMLVFNRWGEMIWSSSSPNTWWDGTVDGEPAKSDVYTYKLTYRGDTQVSEESMVGRVSLVR